MWIDKDGKLFRKGDTILIEKEVNGKVVKFRRSFADISAANTELPKHGYEWVEPEPPAPLPPPPKRYSTLKIIRKLGDEWETYRAKIAEAGVLDQFFAANYLAEDDPVFSAFVSTLPAELVEQLDNCLWEE